MSAQASREAERLHPFSLPAGLMGQESWQSGLALCLADAAASEPLLTHKKVVSVLILGPALSALTIHDPLGARFAARLVSCNMTPLGWQGP